jgi:cytochrome oxidase Cu insertion factor (SCO1/SenC/PrrC family)
MKGRDRVAILALCLLAGAVGGPLARAQSSKAEPAGVKLKVGDVAPDFKLQYFDGSNLKDVSLSQYRGKSNVVVAFYIFAFTGG